MFISFLFLPQPRSKGRNIGGGGGGRGVAGKDFVNKNVSIDTSVLHHRSGVFCCCSVVRFCVPEMLCVTLRISKSSKTNIMNFIPWGAIDKIVEDILTSEHMSQCVQWTHQFLITIGVPANHTPDAEQLLLSVTAVIVTLSSYWYWLGNNHLRKRRDLESNLTKVSCFCSFLYSPFLPHPPSQIRHKELYVISKRNSSNWSKLIVSVLVNPKKRSVSSWTVPLTWSVFSSPIFSFAFM
jgi:hypothetical protein